MDTTVINHVARPAWLLNTLTNCFEKSKKVTLFAKKMVKKTTLNAYVLALCSPYKALQQLHARRKSVMDIVRTLSERRVDDVGTLLGRGVSAVTGKFDILGISSGEPTARWQIVWTLYKLCGIAV